MTLHINIGSDFALLDVKQGREELFEYFQYGKSGGIPITITGEITSVWGHDDGISREFSVSVKSVAIQDP